MLGSCKKKKTLKLSTNVFVDSNDENKFPHKFLLTNTVTLRGFVELFQIIPQPKEMYLNH